jgi:hypothetical protein
MKMNFVITLAFMAALTGCMTINHGHFAVLSPTDLDNTAVYQLLKKDGYGESKSIYWAFYAESPPHLDDAVTNALATNGGIFLKNVSVTVKSWMIPLIWGENAMIVEGEVWGPVTTHTGNTLKSGLGDAARPSAP